MSYEEPRGPKDYPSEIAKGIGLAAGGLTAALLAIDAGLPPLWWWLAVTSAAVVGVGGLAYAVATAAEWFVVLQGDEQPARDVRPSEPRQEQPENEVAEFVARPRARTQPEWRIRLERRFYSDNRFLVGNRPVYLPNDIDVDHIYWLAEWRAEGKLPQVSTRTLDALGLSRWGQPPNAVSLVEFLVEAGAIESLGDRQPYAWTEAGEDTFPDLSAPPLRNGRHANNDRGGGVTSGQHHTTTTTTTHHHDI